MAGLASNLFIIEEETTEEVKSEIGTAEVKKESKGEYYLLKPGQNELIKMCSDIVLENNKNCKINYYSEDKPLKFKINSIDYEHCFSSPKHGSKGLHTPYDHANEINIRKRWTDELLKSASSDNSHVKMNWNVPNLIFRQKFNHNSYLYAIINLKRIKKSSL